MPRHGRQSGPQAREPRADRSERSSRCRRNRSPGSPGPCALAAGVLLLIQQIVMASFLDRSNIEATMASPLYVPTAVAYFVAFCGLLVALVAAYSWEADVRRRLRPRRVPGRPHRDDVPGRRPLVRGVRRAVARRRRAGRSACAGRDAGDRRLHELRAVRRRLGPLRTREPPRPDLSAACRRSPSCSVGSSGSRRPCRHSRSRWRWRCARSEPG